MSIIYSDTSVMTGRPPDMSKMDATKKFLEHFSNSLILKAIQQKSKDLGEKHQATKELNICDRKMEFWRRHPRFNMATATNAANTLRAQWARSQQ